jgi:hypothetical protein
MRLVEEARHRIGSCRESAMIQIGRHSGVNTLWGWRKPAAIDRGERPGTISG